MPRLSGGRPGNAVTLVEADPRLGAPACFKVAFHPRPCCTLPGCLPNQGNGRVGHHLPQPTIDIDRVRARKDKVIKTLTDGLRAVGQAAQGRSGHARATFENRRPCGSKGAGVTDNRLTYEHCVLASGSIPAMPGPSKLPTDRVMDSTGALNLADVPESAAGDRRRLHRPGNGHGLCRAGQQGDGGRSDADGLLPAGRSRPGQAAAKPAGQGVQARSISAPRSCR